MGIDRGSEQPCYKKNPTDMEDLSTYPAWSPPKRGRKGPGKWTKHLTQFRTTWKISSKKKCNNEVV